MDPSVFRQLLNRDPASHKYDFGHVLVIGGSPGMVGAPFLAAQAALRIGAGLVSIASTPAVINKLEKRVAEIMTIRLSENASELMPFIKNRKVSALAIGPGMNPDFALQVIKSIVNLDLPVVIDGGALTAVQQMPDHIRSNFILTPHLGEFARFFNQPPDNFSQAAADFARQNKVILVLKGPPTIICDPVGKTYKNRSGGPELATAGTGDVLSGIIAGIIAQKVEPLTAVKAAVYLHGRAGQIAAGTKTQPGVIASDVIEAIPAALKLVQTEQL